MITLEIPLSSTPNAATSSLAANLKGTTSASLRGDYTATYQPPDKSAEHPYEYSVEWIPQSLHARAEQGSAFNSARIFGDLWTSTSVVAQDWFSEASPVGGGFLTRGQARNYSALLCDSIGLTAG